VPGGLCYRRRVPRNRLLSTFACALAVGLAASSALAQSDEDKAAARSLATQGTEALKANKYAEALDLVTRAEALLHAPTHLLLIAHADIGLGHLVAARENFLKLIHEDLPATAPAPFKHAQQEAKDEIAALEPRIASLRVALDGDKGRAVTVQLDGQNLPAALIGVYRPIDPGKHQIVATPAGATPVTAAVDLREGEKKDISLTIPVGAAAVSVGVVPLPPPPGGPPPPPDHAGGPVKDGGGGSLKTVGFIGLGVGVVGAAVGTAFLVTGLGSSNQGNKEFNACNPGCTTAEKTTVTNSDDSAASSKSVALVGYIVGGAGLVTGISLLVLAPSKSRPATTGTTVTPWFSGNALGLRGTF
jgi:hypothetical protein